MFLNGKDLLPLILLLSACQISNGNILELLDTLDLGGNKNGNACSDFDRTPKECRTAKCNFMCDTRQCSGVQKCANMSTNSDPCAPLCYDKCSCRRLPYCEYDVAGGNCFHIFPKQGMECPDRMFEEWQCVQKGKFYIESGVPCRAVKSSGICDFVEQIRAVNLNGDNFTDKRNVWYRPERDVAYLDDDSTRVPGKFEGNFDGPDGELYSTFIQGSKSNTLSGRCIKYVVDLTFAGHYELSVRMAEFSKNGTGQRYFTVRLNEQPILEDFDLYKVVGAANKPADFVLTFVVNPDGWMHPKGLPSVKLIQGRVTLSFCYGGCDMIPDYGYIVSAFHILRIRSLRPPQPPTSPPGPPSGPSSTTEAPTAPTGGNPSCPPEEFGRPETAFNETICLYPDGACSADSDDYIRKYFENCTIPPTQPGNDINCRQRDGDLCSCKKAGCEYNVESETCRWGEMACAELPDIETHCRREGTFAAYAGLICLSNQTLGNCNVEKRIGAVNLNGPDITDEEGVKYEQDNDSRFVDPLGVRETKMGVSCKDNAPIVGVRPGEEEIYKNIILGHPKVVNVWDTFCVVYPTNITEPGRYLLTLKTAEFFVEKINTRFFTIKLNQIPILPNIDLVRLRGPCTATEFLVNFNVSSNGMLTLRGHSPSRILKDLIFIQFCFSVCDVPQRNFIASGFSIAMLKPVEDLMITTLAPEVPTDGEPPNCITLTDAAECRRYSCEWQLRKDKCVNAPKKCSTRRSPRLTKCKRGNAWYSDGGVLCRSPHVDDDGDCEVKRVAIAVNLNGPSHIDSSNIPHVADSADLYTDQDNTRQPIHVGTWKRAQCDDGVFGINADDEPLYSSLIFGQNSKRAQGRCISYHANVSEDGRYEFGFRTVETYYTDEVRKGRKPRQFNVRLNGKVIFPELNILQKVDACEGIKIVTEFGVQGGYLVPLGLPGSQVAKSGRVDIDFCYGDGVGHPAIDPNYLASSFYIVELAPSKVIIPTTTPSPTSPTSTTEAPTPQPTTKTTAMTTKPTTRPTQTTPPVILSTTPKVVPPVTESPPVIPRCGHEKGEVHFENVTVCNCVKAGCDVFYGVQDHKHLEEIPFTCTKREQDCAKFEQFEKDILFPHYDTTACRRTGGTYSFGGAICVSDYEKLKNGSDDHHCPVERQLLAIRFHGSENYTDARNITYTPMSLQKPTDTNYALHYRQLRDKQDGGAAENEICHTDNSPRYPYMNLDHQLWHRYVTGNSKPEDHNACFMYSVDIPEEGTYELIVKTAEYELEEGRRRAFEIRVNNETVFFEIDILNIYGKPCHATDLVAKFDVKSNVTKLEMRGFKKETKILNKKVDIHFCKGRKQCLDEKVHRDSYEFTGVAFAVLQLQRTLEDGDP